MQVMSLKQLSSPNANHCLVGVDLKNFLVFFESYFADIVGCLDEPIKSMAEKVIFAKGKRIRPSLVYLFGSTSTDSNTDKLLKATLMILGSGVTVYHAYKFFILYRLS